MHSFIPNNSPERPALDSGSDCNDQELFEEVKEAKEWDKEPEWSRLGREGISHVDLHVGLGKGVWRASLGMIEGRRDGHEVGFTLMHKENSPYLEVDPDHNSLDLLGPLQPLDPRAESPSLPPFDALVLHWCSGQCFSALLVLTLQRSSHT
jgi:hypothetical protein